MTTPKLGFIPIGLENIQLFLQRLVDIAESTIHTRNVYVNGTLLSYDHDGTVVKERIKRSTTDTYKFNLDGSAIKIDLDPDIGFEYFSVYNYRHSDNLLYKRVESFLNDGEAVYYLDYDNGDSEEKTIDLKSNKIRSSYKCQNAVWRLTYDTQSGHTELICNGPAYALLYSPTTNMYIAGCRTFTREDALKHWGRIANKDDGTIPDSRKQRAIMFVKAINNHNPGE